MRISYRLSACHRQTRNNSDNSTGRIHAEPGLTMRLTAELKNSMVLLPHRIHPVSEAAILHTWQCTCAYTGAFGWLSMTNGNCRNDNRKFLQSFPKRQLCVKIAECFRATFGCRLCSMRTSRIHHTPRHFAYLFSGPPQQRGLLCWLTPTPLSPFLTFVNCQSSAAANQARSSASLKPSLLLNVPGKQTWVLHLNEVMAAPTSQAAILLMRQLKGKFPPLFRFSAAFRSKPGAQRRLVCAGGMRWKMNPIVSC